ncbi:MAG: type II toxin-antitoxin system RelE/ParE family toxin [Bacteroidota bacterium]
MPQVFRLLPTTRFQRDFEEILKGNPSIIRKLEPVKNILIHDPYNRSRRYDIKKLKDVAVGEGQWRIRSGKYRLRYDIIGTDVILYSFKHRKEAY